MGKIRKNLTSFIVFGINLILMGVGFLFIKNSDEIKKIASNNDFSDPIVEDIAKNKDAVVESIPTPEKIVNETPKAKDASSVSVEPFANQTPSNPQNILSSTAPTQPLTSSSSSQNSSTSKKKSSAKTKTS